MAAEQLMQSPNPSVRRTAVYLLKEFGGNEALPELERAAQRQGTARAARGRARAAADRDRRGVRAAGAAPLGGRPEVARRDHARARTHARRTRRASLLLHRPEHGAGGEDAGDLREGDRAARRAGRPRGRRRAEGDALPWRLVDADPDPRACGPLRPPRSRVWPRRRRWPCWRRRVSRARETCGAS